VTGKVIEFDQPRSQGGEACRHNEGEDWDDELIDDDTDVHLYRDGDGDALFHLCDDTTVGKACNGCGVPLYPFEVVRGPIVCNPPAKPTRRLRRREVKGDVWPLAAEVKPDTVAITTNGFVKRNGQAVMGKGCALEAARR
jgi:hypothetical protein